MSSISSSGSAAASICSRVDQRESERDGEWTDGGAEVQHGSTGDEGFFVIISNFDVDDMNRSIQLSTFHQEVYRRVPVSDE